MVIGGLCWSLSADINGSKKVDRNHCRPLLSASNHPCSLWTLGILMLCHSDVRCVNELVSKFFSQITNVPQSRSTINEGISIVVYCVAPDVTHVILGATTIFIRRRDVVCVYFQSPELQSRAEGVWFTIILGLFQAVILQTVHSTRNRLLRRNKLAVKPQPHCRCYLCTPQSNWAPLAYPPL
jgi:hypothetical protein